MARLQKVTLFTETTKEVKSGAAWEGDLSPIPALRPSTAVSSLTARRLTRLAAGSCQRHLTAVPKPRRPAPRPGLP